MSKQKMAEEMFVEMGYSFRFFLRNSRRGTNTKNFKSF